MLYQCCTLTVELKMQAQKRRYVQNPEDQKKKTDQQIKTECQRIYFLNICSEAVVHYFVILVLYK